MRRVFVGVGAIALASSAAANPYLPELRPRFERAVDETAQTQGTRAVPWIGSSLMLAGNFNLAEEGEDEIDLAGIEVAPGIYASYLSPRAQGFIDYTLIGRLWEDSAYNDVSHRLMANGTYEVVPEWFRMGGTATYSDAVIDPTQSYNYGGNGIFEQNNLAERATASLSPELYRDFRNLRFDARYTYGRVWYLDTPDQTGGPIFSANTDDSVDQQALVSLSTREERRSASMRLYYELQDSDFERTVDYRYERTGAEIGFAIGRDVRFVADGGLETDLDESTTAGGLDSGFWHAGLQWRPDTRTSLDARYGERFFGESWSLQFSRDTRFVTVRVAYSEDPEVYTRRIGINFDPGELPLPDPDVDPSGYTSAPYVAKNGTVTLLAEGAKTHLRLDLYDRRREFISEFQPDEKTEGVRFNAIRDIGANLYAELDTRYDDVENGRRDFQIGDPFLTHYYDFDLMGRLSWEAYRNFIATAEAGYFHRSGQRNYDGEWLALRFAYTF